MRCGQCDRSHRIDDVLVLGRDRRQCRPNELLPQRMGGHTLADPGPPPCCATGRLKGAAAHMAPGLPTGKRPQARLRSLSISTKDLQKTWRQHRIAISAAVGALDTGPHHRHGAGAPAVRRCGSRLRHPARPSPAGGAGLGGGASRAQAQARDAVDPVGGVHRGRTRRVTEMRRTNQHRVRRHRVSIRDRVQDPALSSIDLHRRSPDPDRRLPFWREPCLL